MGSGFIATRHTGFVETPFFRCYPKQIFQLTATSSITSALPSRRCGHSNAAKAGLRFWMSRTASNDVKPQRIFAFNFHFDDATKL